MIEAVKFGSVGLVPVVLLLDVVSAVVANAVAIAVADAATVCITLMSIH